MIHESSYWKEPLLEMARRLTALTVKLDLSEEQFAQIERDIFIGFYSIRRLLEAHEKITDETRSKKIKLRWHGNCNVVTRHNRHRIDELYDLNNSQEEMRDIFFVCHRIIHSYIFTPYFNQTGFAGIIFTSDIDKDKRIYLLNAEEIIRIFKIVGNDYPHKIIWKRDDMGKESLTVD